MPRLEPLASFDKRGVWIFSRYRCVVKDLAVSRTLNRGRYDRLMAAQTELPVEVLHDGRRRRRLWLYRDEFYWEDEAFDADAVQALVLEQALKRERRLQRARSLLLREASPELHQSRVIPMKLRVEVWNRDGGRCVACGAEHDLQFDHVIPVSWGGATSAGNLQLLCEECNRRKGASLA
jgi:hypothetical protein